jgi:uncharacterized protein (DUF2164 family)
MKKDKVEIRLSKEKREEMIAAIKAYFLAEREEELDDLSSGFILDFIIEKLAPEFYNQAWTTPANTCRTGSRMCCRYRYLKSFNSPAYARR